MVFEVSTGYPNCSCNQLSFSNNGVHTSVANRLLYGRRDTVWTTNLNYDLLELGMDIATTGVEAESGITSFGLFPNPAIGGRFNVSFDARRAIRETSVTVTDAAGRQVYSKTYLGVGASFFREVNLSGAAPGIYFVKVAADGAVISRRVVVE